MAEKVRRHVTLSADVNEELEIFSEKTGDTYSDIVNQALREYLLGPSHERIEDKLDKILGAVQGEQTASKESSEKKEKSRGDAHETDTLTVEDPTEYSDDVDETSDEYLRRGPLELGKKNQTGRANRIFNWVLLRYPDRPIHSRDIELGIEKVASSSDHSLRTYKPLVIERLNENGYCRYDARDMWYPTKEARDAEIRDQLIAYAEELESLVSDGSEDTEWIYENVKEAQELLADAEKCNADLEDIENRIQSAIADGKRQAGDSEIRDVMG